MKTKITILAMALLAGIFTQTAIAQITVAGSNGANGNYSSFT